MLGHQLIQEQEQYPPFFKAIKMRYAAFPEYQEQASMTMTEEKETSTLYISAKPEVEIITSMKPFGLRGEHYK